MASLNLSNSPAGVSVRLKPLVLFNICDAYIRRNESQARVIGTLLGHIADGVVHIQNCYAVPHNESNDQVRDERPLGSTAPYTYRRHGVSFWSLCSESFSEGCDAPLIKE